MVLSKSCEYGLRALTYLASQKPEQYYSIKLISEELNLSFHFLTKILQNLTDAGILDSARGPKGGIALAKKPNEIMLVEIVAAIDGLDVFHECILGLQGCGHQQPCPLHEQWLVSRELLKHMFEETPLSEAAEKVPFSRLKGEPV